MADQKLSQLTELAVEPADVDEIYVSDGGTSKRITYGTLKTALLARANHTGTQTASTISDFASAVAATASVTANTAKISADDPALISALAEVTAAGGDYAVILDTSASPNALKKILISDLLDNANHSGDMTGSAALTAQPAIITGKGAVTVAGSDLLLVADVSASPQVLGQVTAQSVANLFDASGYLPLSGGELTGDITFAASSPEHTVDGRNLSADGAKLDGIEANADVTDTANVTAAGALMDSEVTNLAAVKAFDPTDYATAAQGSTADTAMQPGDDAADLGSGAATDGYVLTADGAGGAAWEAAAAGSGDFMADGSVDMTGEFRTDVGTFDSDVADGASAVAYSFDTQNTYSTSGAKLLSLKNNATEKAYIDKDGYVYAGGRIYPSASQTHYLSAQSQGLQIGGILGFGANYVTASTWTGLWSTGLAFGRAQSPTIKLHESNTDFATGDFTISGGNAGASSTTNLDGGNLILNGGAGASGSAGNAHGGNVNISGGTGYGTGHDGYIIMSNLPTSDPGVAGALYKELDATTSPNTYFLKVSA